MLTMTAPAKVNLNLHVLGRRPDGYHDLLTRMQKLDLADRLDLEVSDRPGISFSCSDPTLPAGDGNLAVRAARALLEAAGVSGSRGATIRLHKRIPAAAGLGGGSSDAGTVLRGLNRLLATPLSPDELLELARTIGADVPFFASGMTAALATGIGERLQPVDNLAGYTFLLVNPDFEVSTAWVFDNYPLTTTKELSTLRGSRLDDGSGFRLDWMHNDLERVTERRYPVVAEIKRTLLRAGAVRALMSGSGPTVYGLFAGTNSGDTMLNQAAGHLTRLYGDRVYVSRAYTGA